MTRLTIEQTATRSGTFQSRFELLIDDQPHDGRTTAPMVPARTILVPGLNSSASVADTEHNR